jgi:nitroreductase
MDFKELARTRFSCRGYRGEPVEEEKLALVLEAARLAPTACNRQAFKLYVIPTAGREDDVRRLYDRGDWVAEAPLLIGIAGNPAANWKRLDGHNYTDVDCAIVMDHLILQAADLGLGTCWIGAFDAAAARRLLDLPVGWEPVAFTPLGYPADTGRAKARKPLDEILVRM